MRMPFGRIGSFTWQIIVTTFVLQLLAAGLLLGLVQSQNRKQVETMQREAVAHRLADLTALYRLEGASGLAHTINAAIGEFTSDEVIQLRGPDGRVMAGNILGRPDFAFPTAVQHSMVVRRIGSRKAERALVTAARLASGEELLIGSVVEDDLRLISRITEASSVALLLAVPLAIVAALLIGRQLDRRLRSVTATASGVERGDLSRRVPRDGSHDAFDELAAGINSMLGRMDELVSELRLVTESLAHDLRSPLTRIRNRLERVRVSDHDDPDGEIIGAIDHDLRLVLKTLGTMLQISRATAGIGVPAKEPTDLTELLFDISDTFEPAAAEEGFEICVSNPAGEELQAHRSLLRQAISNLIENAIQYAAGGNRIELAVEDAGEYVAISVRDNGCGVPAEQHERIKHRFVTLDTARSAAGSGLGLALADAIAHLHGGELVLRDANPGLEAMLLMKR